MRVCIVCGTPHQTSRLKFCSERCYRAARKNSVLISRERLSKTYTCRHCGEQFTRYRERSGFCSRRCGTNFNLEILRKGLDIGRALQEQNKAPLIERLCDWCQTTFVFKGTKSSLAVENHHRFCSSACRAKWTGVKNSGANNHFWGRKHTPEEAAKKAETLKTRYGVTNAFALAKRRTTSKGQRELHSLLQEELRVQVFREKLVLREPTEVYADIFIPSSQLVVEYHGDWWHANPKKYQPEWWNPKKRMTAQEIWNSDMLREIRLKTAGYKVLVVWESDFQRDKKEVLARITLEIEANDNTPHG